MSFRSHYSRVITPNYRARDIEFDSELTGLFVLALDPFA
jgi:hypothetical protein